MKFRSSPTVPSLRSRPLRSRRATSAAQAGGRAGTRDREAGRAGERPGREQAASRVPLWKQVEDEERSRRRGRHARGSARGGRRFAVVYDLEGPRCRVALGWFALALVALSVGASAVVVLYAAVAAVAAVELARSWQSRFQEPNEWVAGGGAAAIALAVLFGLQEVGAVLLAVVVVAVLAARLRARSETSVAGVAGLTVSAAMFVGLVGVGLGMTYHYGVGAAVLLVLFVSAYECGDYLVGSGASNRIEGPLAGILALAVVALGAGALRVPPFRGVDVAPFAALAALCCPLGQLFGSVLLPDARVRALALRRLDSLLVLAPLWAWLIGWYLQ